MDDRIAAVTRLLHEAAETHHVVFRITDGTDDDWATWYSQWLVELSELPALIGRKPARSEVTHLLVQLDRDYGAERRHEPWEGFYARAIVTTLGGS